ncbi:deaminated glutathione amidase-like isoform X2 [Oppia nitens]|nr:deaminated glutathione amidase-like isoform X2 [Oppia nitens]
MSTESSRTKSLIAVCQLTSTDDKEKNFNVAENLIRSAAGIGCQMVFLPECFDMICETREKTMANTEPIDGPIVSRYRQLAKEVNVWLSLGGLHEKKTHNDDGKAFNAHIVVDNNGSVVSVYRKVHLFNLEIPGVIRLVESEFSTAGDKVVSPVQTPIGRVGLGICYDIRFAEFAISLAKSGADILTYPSSFTIPTGSAHWEVMLRTRAIETQCYVVAAAQTGPHNKKRSSYGHAMIIDPWGAIIGQCNDGIGYAVAQIDLNFLKDVRQKLPVWSDRKPHLYGNIIPAEDIEAKLDSNTDQSFQFGPTVVVKPEQIFYKTKQTVAFVNHRPILAGHVLVAPIRAAKRLQDLNSTEITDFFTVVQKVQKAIETEYDAKASTVGIQDGIDAGQSIEHLHAHLLPRKPTDFGGNVDQLWAELQKHDKTEHKSKYRVRTDEEMSAESNKLKSYF